MFIPKKALLLGSAASITPQEVFSVDLWAGNGSTQTITSGLDMAGEGGLVWIKSRTSADSHYLFNTISGVNTYLSSNATSIEQSLTDLLTAFNSDGYSLGFRNGVNSSSYTYAGWSFRRAPKFFDIVTYTGDGVGGRQIPHALGTTPGMIVVKARSISQNWAVYHRNLGNTYRILLDSTTEAYNVGSVQWNSTSPTSTHFTLGTNTTVNQSGATYVAYVFAQNPDLIDCGSYVGNGSTSGPVVTCGSGWTPQWLLVKNASSGSTNWPIVDSSRGFGAGVDPALWANLSNAETAPDLFATTPAGFQVQSTGSSYNTNGDTYIYMAIRAPV